ncbi:hypothetical protein [Pseudomonas sp. 6D_7.1_Bac1]|uniref:hypothetical protein n=1 Tax=Pseudomonas sp. 6D_7.1_Bac1 TaxID=2971615 RepID=UPI0021CA506A|nr:hypothetical protein [Pseudomonas sp. 6D_7.1_Bac1]MCU1751958.1 hypothetical protein [Pseudomonas sp. 6D_7.1_Bac1]
MEDKEQIYFALYNLNLTQLAIGAALEDLTGLIQQIGYLTPETSESLRRHLSTIERNSDRSCEAIYSLINLSHEPEVLWSPPPR